MNIENKLKPNKLAFIWSRIATKLIFGFVIIAVICGVIKFVLPGAPIILIFFLLFGFSSLIIYWLESIVYKKLSYVFMDDKIIQKGGSLFTDYETELNIKNITHVSLRLPFIENKIFNTGHIDIESAGASTSEIHLCAMDDFNEHYALLTSLMKQNGFNLEKGEVVMLEKPNSLGVFFEVFKSFLGGLFVVWSLLGGFLYDEDGNKNELIYNNVMGNLFPLVGVGVGIVLIIHIFKFLDLKRRVYKIYDNVITYKEGFLSKNHSVLPFENLTDSGTTQTLVDKIFGLYDVKISCQGSGHEILFKNISGGQGMSDTLDKLIDKKDLDVSSQRSGESVALESGDRESIVDEIETRHATSAQDSSAYNLDYTKDLRVDFFRVVKFPLLVWLSATILLIVSVVLIFSLSTNNINNMVGFFLMPIIIVSGFVGLAALVSSVFGYVRYRTTKFRVAEKRIQYRFNFLSSKDVEFNIDKITGVYITKSFIDKWFKTMSVHFWSIGASSSLSFSNIKDEENLIHNIVSKIGIKKEEETRVMRSEFSLMEYLKSAIFSSIVFAFVLLIAIALSFINIALAFLASFLLISIFTLVYLYHKEVYKRTKMVFCGSYVYFQKGWLFRKFYFVKHRDIKDIKTLRYPFSSEGMITFNVSGDKIVTNAKKKTSIISNNFTFAFVQNIRDEDELIDYILKHQPDKTELQNIKASDEFRKMGEIIYTVKPSLKNVIVPLLVFLLPFNALVLFTIIMLNSFYLILFIVIFNVIAFSIASLPVIMTTYYLDNYRVLEKSGVIYKKQISVIYDKIDFINNNQGFLNKIFRNGNITVNTVGSSRTELLIKNIPEFKDFYEKLKKRYEKK